MKSGIKHAPFTAPQGDFPRMIVTPIYVAKPGVSNPGDITKLCSRAQWDTGADFCMISPSLVRKLRLKSAGEAFLNTVDGTDTPRPSYEVDLTLPNGIFFSDVPVIEDAGLDSLGIDFLIGMMVINEIDFALTHNDKQETVLSISYPAGHLVDFCDETYNRLDASHHRDEQRRN